MELHQNGYDYNESAKENPELLRRGLTPEIIKAAGLRHGIAEEVALILGRPSQSGGIIIPYHDPFTGAVVLNRVRPDVAPIIAGKPAKYLAPSESGNHIYLPPGAAQWIRDPSIPLIVTEGEFKTLWAYQAGLHCIGLSGVYNFRGRKGQPVPGPIPDLDLIEWHGRVVTIIFDSDIITNNNVRAARDALARELYRRGAQSVLTINLPELNGEKTGLDDFLQAEGVEAFHDLDTEEMLPLCDLKRGAYVPVVRCAKDIEPEAVGYLWYPYFPLGKLGLLGGDAGVGKTYLTAAVATAHSLGTWPFFLNGRESAKDPGHTLIFSCEDGVEDTYIPRLVSLGANRDFIHFVDGKKDWKGNLHRVVMTDRDILARVIQEHKARLVIFDPLQGFLPPKAEMSKMETVRPVVDALATVARATRCHILLIGHLSKARQETAGYKFLGSVDWYNAARSAMLATINPEEPDIERFFHHIKHSLGRKAPGMRYSISEANIPPFLWGQSTDVTIEDVLAGGDKHNTTKEEEAKEFLKAELAEGPRIGKELEAEAKEQFHISPRTLWAAKKNLKIQSHKGAGEEHGLWYWSLPTSQNADNIAN